MSINATPSSSSQGGALSCNVTTVVAVLAAMTFSASGAAPTPLYQEYQSHFGLTPFMITVIFATYVLCPARASIPNSVISTSSRQCRRHWPSRPP
jgi:hypothetical protein